MMAIIWKGFLKFLIFLTIIFVNAADPSPNLCSTAGRWILNGRDLVRDYRGRVLLLSFIPLRTCNETCEKELRKYETITERLDDVRILVIAPKEEAAANVRTLAWRFPRIRFEHESSEYPIWNLLGASENDHFIFDRCTRLTQIIRKSTDYHRSLEALKSTVTSEVCGRCDYDWLKVTWPSFHPPAYHQPVPANVPIPQVHPTKIVANVRRHSLEGLTKDDQPQKYPKSQASFVDGNNQRQETYYQFSGSPGQQNIQRQEPYQNQQQQSPQQRSAQEEYQLRMQRYYQELEERKRQRQHQISQRQGQQPLAMTAPQNNDNNRHRERTDLNGQRTHPSNTYQNHQPTQSPVSTRTSSNHRRLNAPPSTGGSTNQEPMFPITTTQTSPAVRYGKDPYSDRYRYGLGARTDLPRSRMAQMPRTNQESSQRRAQKDQQLQQREREAQEQRERELSAALENSRKHYDQREQVRSTTPEPLIVSRNGHGNGVDSNGKAVDPAPLYPEGAEEAEDYYYSDWTTVAPALQVPTPSLGPPPPPTQPLKPHDKTFGLDLPCSGYTDAICYQQQTQLKPAEIHKCCRERVLFTDQCISGKCSNLTQQLCCIQRFLQAKQSCCLDERQGEVTTPGDYFSQCCFENFVDQNDPCCPRSYALEQWRSVHELCLPNVDVDLSRVKVPAPLVGTSLMTEFDFGKTDKWKFECRYGDHVQQFSYFEDVEDEEKGEEAKIEKT